MATAKFKELYQNKAAKFEKAYTTPDSRNQDWYWRDTIKTEEIPRDNMSQQAHKSGNITPIDNEGPGNMAQPSNNSNPNSQISMI